MRTLKDIPLAATVGCQARVRKALREIGAPASAGVETIVTTDVLDLHWRGHGVE